MAVLKGSYQAFILLVFAIVLYFAKKNTLRHRDIKSNDQSIEINNQPTTFIDNLNKSNNSNTSINLILIKNEIRKKIIRDKMLFEYPNICYDMQIFLIKNIGNIQIQNHDKTIQNNININNDNEIILLTSSSEIKEKSNDGIIIKQPHNHRHVDNIHGSNAIAYIFVLLLVISLIRAALDTSNHFKKDTTQKDDFSRRTSLQEFAQSRHSRKNSTKRKALSRQESTNSTTGINMPFLNGNYIFNRLFEHTSSALVKKPSTTTPLSSAPPTRISPKNILVNTSNLISEPGSPAKPAKLLGGRPAPLIRRQSFPVSMGPNINNNHFGGLARRPSIDSCSEGDSSPEVKRRVRMIHRH